jgi:hypothetical protein
MREEFQHRLRYIGQELAFLAAGVVSTRLHSPNSHHDLIALLITLLLYLFAWLAIFTLSSHILRDKSTWRSPLRI